MIRYIRTGILSEMGGPIRQKILCLAKFPRMRTQLAAIGSKHVVSLFLLNFE